MFKRIGTVFNLAISNIFQVVQQIKIVFNISISNISTYDFKLPKTTYFANDASTPVAVFTLDFVA